MAGTLQLGDGTSGHDASLPAAGGINNNAALVYDLYGSQVYGGAISGPGSLSKIGVGSLTLTGANNPGAGVTVDGALDAGVHRLFGHGCQRRTFWWATPGRPQ